jgi:hypothetical protein
VKQGVATIMTEKSKGEIEVYIPILPVLAGTLKAGPLRRDSRRRGSGTSGVSARAGPAAPADAVSGSPGRRFTGKPLGARPTAKSRGVLPWRRSSSVLWQVTVAGAPARSHGLARRGAFAQAAVGAKCRGCPAHGQIGSRHSR